MGIAGLAYFIAASLLLGASGRSVQLKSVLPIFSGLIVALLLATMGWIALVLLERGAKDLLPKTLDSPKWLLGAIALLPSFCSGLIAAGIPYGYFRPRRDG